MKQSIKIYLYFEVSVLSCILGVCTFLFPMLYVDDNVWFVVFYILTLCPLIFLGIYKLTFFLFNKIENL